MANSLDSGPGQDPEMRIISRLLLDALAAGASSVLLTPDDEGLALRQQVGEGQDTRTDSVEPGMTVPVIRRLQGMAGLPRQTNEPHTGRIDLAAEGRAYTLTVRQEPTESGPSFKIDIRPKDE